MTDCDATTERITIGGRTATESEKRNGLSRLQREASHTSSAGRGGTVEARAFRFGAESALAILDSNRCSGTKGAYARLKLVIYKNLHANLPEVGNF